MTSDTYDASNETPGDIAIERLENHVLELITSSPPQYGRDHQLADQLDHFSSLVDLVAKECFAANFSLSHSIETKFGISMRYCQKLFQRFLGITPMQYVRYKRITEARKLFTQFEAQRGNIKEIANMCGYNHLGRFSQDCKTITGQLPTQLLRASEIPAPQIVKSQEYYLV